MTINKSSVKRIYYFSFCIFFIVFCGRINAGARFTEKYYSNPGLDKYIYGKIIYMELNDTNYRLNQWNSRIIETGIEYLGNGLLLVQDNWNKYFIYNEFYNENIKNGYKLNENTTLLKFDIEINYNIFFYPCSIIITTDEINKSNYRLEMRFDENTKKLIAISNERFYNNEINERYSYYYEYVYDIFGRLEFVYRIVKNEKILFKSVYYDSIYRVIPRPFLRSLDEIPPDKEIIVYNNNIIKYYIRTYPAEGDYASSEIIEKEEARLYLLTIEYDENGNEIKQTLFREGSKYFESETQLYIIENEEFDLNNNWTKQTVFWLDNSGEYRIVNKYQRTIFYEKN